MSYGEAAEAVDFGGLRLACISGNNGEGKSSLLDAMTWALWGVARGTDQSGRGVDDLIRSGAKEAKITFEFQTGEDIWRVERSRRRGRSMSIALARYDGEGEWKNASGATQQNTQKYIETLLGLDYKTFINSAFLLQGRADEFSRQNASERKKILSDILGLDIFDDLSERARGQSREARTQADILEAEISRLTVELAREDELKKKEAELQARLEETGENLKKASEELKSQQNLLTQLEEKARLWQRQQEQLKKLLQQLSNIDKERTKTRGKLTESENLLTKEKEIEDGFTALAQRREEERRYGEKAAQFAGLSSERERLAGVIETEKAALITSIGSLRKQIAALDKVGKDEELKREVERIQHEIAAVETLLQKAGEIEKRLLEDREKLTRLEERNRQLESLAGEKQESLTLLQHAGAVCPVCKGALSEARREELITETNNELKEIADESHNNHRSASSVGAAIKSCENELKKTAAERKRQVELKQKLGQCESRLMQAQAAREQLKGLQDELQKLERILQTEAFALDTRKELLKVETNVAAVGYDAAAHKAAAENVRALMRFENEKNKLEGARTAAAVYRESLARAEENYANMAVEVEAARKESENLQKKAAALPEAKKKAIDLSNKAEKIESELAEVERQFAVIKNTIAKLMESREILGERQKDKERALEDAVIYNELAVAFGKKGVQALIIETALPQLERHANDLLDRLTEGRMQVAFITQKERGDAVAETLEIRIRDQNGERRYEMYSGGEAFRLNFAIRLALSKLLTQRAGAELSTLIIDEGFGSQDTEGRQRLIEAIRLVSENFERILVITHLDELKAEFTDRIEVSKDETGSHIKQIRG